jgi:hypothetical protein
VLTLRRLHRLVSLLVAGSAPAPACATAGALLLPEARSEAIGKRQPYTIFHLSKGRS